MRELHDKEAPRGRGFDRDPRSAEMESLRREVEQLRLLASSDVQTPLQAERAALERIASLQAVTAALSEARLPSDVAKVVAIQMAAVLGADQAVIAGASADNAELILLGHTGLNPWTSQAFARFPVDLDLPLAKAFRTGQQVWISSREEFFEQCPRRPDVGDLRTQAIACLPLILQGVKLGAIGFGFFEPRVLDPSERSLAEDLARQTALALDRARLYETEQQARRRLEILAKVSPRFTEPGFALEAHFENIVCELGTNLYSATGLSLLDADGYLRQSAVYHPVPEAQELLRSLGQTVPLRVGEGVSGSVATTGKSVLITKMEPREMIARVLPSYRGFFERFPVHALICVPLRAHGKIIGTLIATRTREGETYTADDLLLFEELADEAAAAIENSRLQQENAQARSRAEQLYRFAQAVVSAERVEQVFEAALDAMERALRTNRASIQLFDASGVMRFRAWRGLSDDYRRAVEGHSPWQGDAVSPEPILVNDVESESGMAAYLPAFRAEGIGALGFIPIVTGGRLLGRTMVYYDRPHRFSRHEVELAIAIANHLASVVERFAVLGTLQETIHFNEVFAGVLAHDLRNPLGAIMSAAQLLLRRKEGESERLTKPVSRILNSGERMRRMIEQLLDFTRVRVGAGIEIEPRETNLAELSSQAVAEFELAHPEWNIEQQVSGDLRGTWDSDRLLQTISNLIANAGQHGTANAGIRIKLDGTRPDAVRLEIHNQGAIPQALLPSLFDPFRRSRHGRERSRGLGLGLFIVKEILSAHGGTVEVVSSESSGTTFTIELPRQPVARPASGAGAASPTMESPAPRTICRLGTRKH